MGKDSNRLKIKRKIRATVVGTQDVPRLSVFKSNKEIYAQLIVDGVGQTIASSSSKLLKTKGNKVEVSAAVGKALAEKAVASGINKVVFDRNGYVYHGRVKALAEGAREGGLKF